jgi:hypothetical protein
MEKAKVIKNGNVNLEPINSGNEKVLDNTNKEILIPLFLSRIQILDRLSKKWGEKDGITNFSEYCDFYNSEAILKLVYQAMEQYAQQEIKRKQL